MPRLPRFVPRAGIPETTGSPMLDPGAAAAPSAAASRGLLSVSLGASELLGSMGRAAAHREALEAAMLRQAEASETAMVSAEVEVEIKEGLSTLRQTTSDPDAYYAGAKKVVADAMQGVEKRPIMAGTKRALVGKLSGVAGKELTGALHTKDQLWVSRETGRMEITLDNLRTLAAEAPSDAEFDRYVQDGVNAVVTGRPMLGDAKVFERAKKFQQDALVARADRHIDRDPQGFADKASSAEKGVYTHLDPLTREAEVVKARQLVSVRERDAQHRSDRQRVESERASADANDRRYGELQARVAEGSTRAGDRPAIDAVSGETSKIGVPVTSEELVLARRRRELTAEQFDHLMRERSAPRPSDPETLDRVRLEVGGMNPAMSLVQIDALYASGRLNGKDAGELKVALRARLDHLESKRETKDGRDHKEGEDRLRAFFGIVGTLEKYDQKTIKAYSLARDEYEVRSRFYRGREDPLAVVDDLIPRYSRVLGTQRVESIEDLRKSLPYRTPQDLEREFRRPGSRVSQAAYDFYKQQFLQLRFKELDHEERLRREAAYGTGKAPAPTATPPTTTPGGADPFGVRK